MSMLTGHVRVCLPCNTESGLSREWYPPESFGAFYPRASLLISSMLGAVSSGSSGPVVAGCTSRTEYFATSFNCSERCLVKSTSVCAARLKIRTFLFLGFVIFPSHGSQSTHCSLRGGNHHLSLSLDRVVQFLLQSRMLTPDVTVHVNVDQLLPDTFQHRVCQRHAVPVLSLAGPNKVPSHWCSRGRVRSPSVRVILMRKNPHGSHSASLDPWCLSCVGSTCMRH